MHKNSRTRHSFLYVNLKLIHTFPQKYMYTYTRQAFYSLDTHSNKSMQRSHHIQKYHIFTKYFLTLLPHKVTYLSYIYIVFSQTFIFTLIYSRVSEKREFVNPVFFMHTLLYSINLKYT